MSVTAIRRFDRAQALDQLRVDPTLAKASLSSLAKRWGVARSTARAWVLDALVEPPATPVASAAALTTAPEGLPPLPAAPTAPVPVPAMAAPPLPGTATLADPQIEISPEPRGGWAANLLAYATAALLAAVAAYFSVSGMVEIFPGAPVAVIAFAGAMELSKLVTAGWLARQWRAVGVPLRIVLICLIAGLAAINAAGVYGRLVEAHVSVAVATESSIAERLGALDARIDAQGQSVASLDQRLAEIDSAIAKLTERGRASAALAAIANQRAQREALSASRTKEMASLIELRADRAKLDAEKSRAEAAQGPVVYMAAMLGLPLEVTVRWLILLMVLTCDPTAIALTVAAARRA
ncbi:MAG TPA: hypothetical protein VKW08_05030 [Xanthobacteraceae bacterium]|jgi:hypothetical protein|nr:hypothetical protein [Xanthobacteraceae bacterium]